ncbi:MAG: helix-turn-helix transcriptional regulator [Bacteroidales bacterium]|nr:helix-turn-helix transcriptional regulator [Bacteroidales bacterium]
MNRKNIMAALRVIRMGKGLSQEALAQDLGITTSAYSKIERGETNVSLDRVLQILDSLAVNFYEVLYANEMIVKNASKGQVAEYSMPEYYSVAAMTQDIRNLRLENQRLASLLKVKDELLKIYVEEEEQKKKEERSGPLA